MKVIWIDKDGNIHESDGLTDTIIRSHGLEEELQVTQKTVMGDRS